jgi:hypothetical protein
MSHPPSSYSLNISLISEWEESTPTLRSCGGLSFIAYSLLDSYREDRLVDEGGADEDSTR